MELKQPIPSRFELSGGFKVAVSFIYPEIAEVNVSLDGKHKRGYIRYVNGYRVCLSMLQSLSSKSLLKLLEFCRYANIKTNDGKILQISEEKNGVLVRRCSLQGIVKSYSISWDFLEDSYRIKNLQQLIFAIQQTPYKDVIKFLRLDLDEP